MQGEKEFLSRIYYGINLDELVPADHLLKKLDKLVSFNWVREKTKNYYSHTGKPSIDPVVLVKMMIIGYLYDIRSERRLVEDISLNLAYRWYVGYDIDERIPEHSIFSKARKRFGKKLFVEIFEEVLTKCIEAGLVANNEVLMDSTLVRANASMNSIVEVNLSPDEYWRQLEASEIPVSPKGRKSNKDSPNSVGSRFKGGKIDENRMGKRSKNRKATYLHKRSKTDPDATLHFRPGTGPMLAYKAHIAVDSSSIITAVSLSPGAAHDSSKVPELLGQHEKILGTPNFIAADTRYGTQDCLGYLQGKGIKTAINPLTTNNRPGFFSKDLFTHDPQNDSYLCPAGKILTRKYKKQYVNKIIYRAKKEDCLNCSLRHRCIEPHRECPRTVTRFDSSYCENAELCLKSFVGKKLHKLRKTVMEGIFGEAKSYHGLSRAKQRGIDNVEIQLMLTATVLNLKRLFKKLDRETMRNTMQILQDQLQNFLFAIFARFMVRFPVCWA